MENNLVTLMGNKLSLVREEPPLYSLHIESKNHMDSLNTTSRVLYPNILIDTFSGKDGFVYTNSNSLLQANDSAAFHFIHPFDATNASGQYKVFRIATGTESGSPDTPASQLRDRFFVTKNGSAYFENGVGIGVEPDGVNSLRVNGSMAGVSLVLSSGLSATTGSFSSNVGIAGGLGVDGSVTISEGLDVAGSCSLGSIEAGPLLVGNFADPSNFPLIIRGRDVTHRFDGSESPCVVLTRGKNNGAQVSNGEELAKINFNGLLVDNEENAPGVSGASIVASLDGTRVADSLSMPGKLQLRTTPDGSVTPVSRVTIRQSGRVGIGTETPSSTLDVAGDIHCSYFSPNFVGTATRSVFEALVWYTLINGISIESGGQTYIIQVRVQVDGNCDHEHVGSAVLGLVKEKQTGAARPITIPMSRCDGDDYELTCRAQGNSTKSIELRFPRQLEMLEGGFVEVKLKRIL